VVSALQRQGHDVVVLDDLSTGEKRRLSDTVPLLVGSVLDTDLVSRAMTEHGIEGIVHLAAKEAVDESVAKPLWYYHENVTGVLSLLTAVAQAASAVFCSRPALRYMGFRRKGR
jgi:UDP-glucose 4-epimerase